jgi:hypothetical protein
MFKLSVWSACRPLLIDASAAIYSSNAPVRASCGRDVCRDPRESRKHLAPDHIVAGGTPPANANISFWHARGRRIPEFCNVF